MRYGSLQEFLENGKEALAKGPVALIFAEDLVEVDTTIVHHQMAGFNEVILISPASTNPLMTVLPGRTPDSCQRGY